MEDINRRSILKKAGTIGSISLMSTGATAARRRKKDSSDTRNIFESSKVSAIRQELSGLELHRSRATEEVLETESNTITSTQIPSPTGRLQFVETSNGTTEATFFFNDSAEYPEEEHDAPSSVESSLTGTEDGTVFVRGTTESEHDKITSALDESAETISTYKRDDRAGYGAKIGDSQNSAVRRYTVNVEEESTELVEAQTTTIQSADVDSCDAQGVYCTLCIQSAPICGACLSLCASGVGAPACILCAIHTCGFTAADCYTCLDCL